MIAHCVSDMRVKIQSGFTLLEVLVAITLLSLIMVLLASSFHFADASRGASLNKVDEMEGIRQAQRVFKQYLETAQPVWHQQRGQKDLLFSAMADELIFTSSMPAHLGDAGLYEIRLSVSGESGDRGLKFDRRLLHAELYESSSGRAEVDALLLDHAHDLQFHYFGRIDDHDDISNWHSEWSSDERLPELVKLTVEGQSGELEIIQVRLMAQPSVFTPVMKKYLSITQVGDD